MMRFTPFRDARRSGFTLLEMLIVVVIIGLLASIAMPAYQDVQRRAYNAVALTDLHAAMAAIERYVTRNAAFPDEDEIFEEAGFQLSPGVSFEKYDIKDEGAPDARVHMHISHRASPHYYHIEYPMDAAPEQKWKK